MASSLALSRERRRMQHTRGYRTGRPATYFALHRKGFFVPPTSPSTRWALTPPFHPYPFDAPLARLAQGRPRAASSGRFVLCDTVRRRALTRGARACREARAASCPAVSGLSSPNFYRARRYPRLGIKELGATTRPQSQGADDGQTLPQRKPARRCKVLSFEFWVSVSGLWFRFR